MRHLLAPLLALLVAGDIAAQDKPPAKADPKKVEARPEKFTYRVYGLFSPDREKDLRESLKELTDITVVGINYDDAEITVEFIPSKVFPGAKPEQVMDRFDQQVRTETRSTFAIGARRTIAKDKLEQVVIPVVGLDCKACALAAYEAVARLEGVDRATASFKEGRVTALIDPTKTDRAKLEDALKKRNVQLVKP